MAGSFHSYPEAQAAAEGVRARSTAPVSMSLQPPVRKKKAEPFVTVEEKQRAVSKYSKIR